MDNNENRNLFGFVKETFADQKMPHDKSQWREIEPELEKYNSRMLSSISVPKFKFNPLQYLNQKVLLVTGAIISIVFLLYQQNTELPEDGGKLTEAAIIVDTVVVVQRDTVTIGRVTEVVNRDSLMAIEKEIAEEREGIRQAQVAEENRRKLSQEKERERKMVVASLEREKERTAQRKKVVASKPKPKVKSKPKSVSNSAIERKKEKEREALRDKLAREKTQKDAASAKAKKEAVAKKEVAEEVEKPKEVTPPQKPAEKKPYVKQADDDW